MTGDLIERLRSYVDGINGKNELRVGLHMCAAAMDEAAAALSQEREAREKAEKEVERHLEELGRVIMACPQGMRTSPASEGVRQLRASLAEAKRLLEWRDMESAPRDGTVVNVVGRYPDATAGFPRYAAVLTEDDGWFELSRNKPERIIPWAWRPRDGWPQEPNHER